MKKRVVSVILCALMLCTAVFSLNSCSRPPEYVEIEARFRELVEASYSINKVLFGEGLPTYERVYDKTVSSYDVYKEYYYYELKDEEFGKIIAYRTITPKKDENGKLITDFSYLQVFDAAQEGKTAVYEDAASKIYCYAVDYEEKKYDFYYSKSDPETYDYVKSDSEYISIAAIKQAAEKVYSKEYLEGAVYVALFTGAVASDDLSLDSLSARYIEYASDGLGTVLMQSNTYEPLIKETRVLDLSTATMVRPSNKKLVSIEVETYLPSAPDKRLTVTVTLVNQDGEWFLDSGTY